MSSIQNATGRKFENDCVDTFRKCGYWVYNFPVGLGQACDIIAVKDNLVTFVECKTSNTDKFSCKDRFEANQLQAFEYIKSCGNDLYVVMIRFKSGVKAFYIEDLITREQVCFNDKFAIE